jgi:hypothetical protein
MFVFSAERCRHWCSCGDDPVQDKCLADPHLVDPTAWQHKLYGLSRLVDSFPVDGGFKIIKSGDAFIFNVKKEAKNPGTFSLNHEDKLLTESVSSLVKEGALIELHFIPHPWQTDDKNGMSLSIKKLKRVNAKHLSPTSLTGAKRDSPAKLSVLN